MFELRRASAGDAPLIASHRERMFLESGWDPERVRRMRTAFDPWVGAALADGSYNGLIAEAEGAAVGGAGYMRLPWTPHPGHPEEAARGYILNVFVEPAWRGRGCAGLLMARAEAELAAMGLDYLILHATKAGRPLYERIGWTSGTEMVRRLDRDASGG